MVISVYCCLLIRARLVGASVALTSQNLAVTRSTLLYVALNSIILVIAMFGFAKLRRNSAIAAHMNRKPEQVSHIPIVFFCNMLLCILSVLL